MMQCAHTCPRNVFSQGINASLVRALSECKGEPTWMLELRLKALEQFEHMSLPKQHKELLALLDLSALCYYVNPCSLCSCPAVRMLTRAGEARSGESLQRESEVVATTLQKQWQEAGVLFCSMDEAVKKYPVIVRRYFGTVVSPDNNIFAALNGAVWSGGSFVYVPAGVQIDMPLSTFFNIQEKYFGQFERTLIIADSGSRVHYLEGCESSTNAQCVLHSGVVELVALEGAHIRYSTLQHWSPQVFNLVTKRAIAHDHATVEWIDGNVGSKLTMKYPTTILAGKGASAQLISLSIAGAGQVQDSGGSMIHLAPHTRSYILSKSLSSGGGQTHFRGLVSIEKGAREAQASSRCESLVLDNTSSAGSFPHVVCHEHTARATHEAAVSSLDDRQLFYLQSRGIREQEARALVVSGFVDAFMQQLPSEYGIELQRLLEETLSDSSF